MNSLPVKGCLQYENGHLTFACIQKIFQAITLEAANGYKQIVVTTRISRRKVPDDVEQYGSCLDNFLKQSEKVLMLAMNSTMEKIGITTPEFEGSIQVLMMNPQYQQPLYMLQAMIPQQLK